MPRKESAADCPRMCKIFVKGPAPMVPVRGTHRTSSPPLLLWRVPVAAVDSANLGVCCRQD
jgi:hypothetical protein